MYWEFPENFRPAIVRSFLPESLASMPNFLSTSIIGWVYFLKLVKLSLLFGIIKVKFILPGSWNTAPPPDNRLTTGILCSFTYSMFISASVF